MKRISICWLVCAVLSMWLFFNEGSRIHTMRTELTVTGQEFQIDVSSGGSHVNVYAADRRTDLSVQQERAGNRLLLHVEGKLPEDGGSSKTNLFFLCDDDSESGNWMVTGTRGLAKVRCIMIEGRRVWGRSFLAVWPFFVLAVWMIYAAGIRRLRKRTRLDDLIGYLRQEESCQAAWSAGEQWFHRMEEKQILARCCTMILMVLGPATALNLIWHMPSDFYEGRLFIIFLAGEALILLLVLAEYVCWSKSFVRILTEENRPMTAAAAYLLEAQRGCLMGKAAFRIMLHNAAVGLYRAGWYEEALELSALCETKGKKGVRRFIESNLRSACLWELGRMEEANQEEEVQKKLAASSSRLQKHEDVKRCLLSIKIRNALSRQDIGYAKACLETYEESCRNDYQRMPALAVQAKLCEQNGEYEQAEQLYRRLLCFSPENAVVREALPYGACTYREGVIRYGTASDRLVRAGMAVLAAAILATAVGSCIAGNRMGQKKENLPLESALSGDDAEQTADSGETVSDIPESEKDRTESGDTDESVQAAAASFRVTLPENWRNLVIEKQQGSDGCIYYQKKSYERMGDGWLFSIMTFTDGSYVNLPDYQVWGYDGAKVYIAVRPTDVCFYVEDEVISEEYGRLSKDISKIRESFRILSDTARYDGDEFIFANSQSCFLKEEELWNLSSKWLRIAKNEIYARRGRKFADQELQAYFNGCSWYEGTIEPDDFTEDRLNEYEKANVLLIQKRQQETE